jgi:hypothetical protein
MHGSNESMGLFKTDFVDRGAAERRPPPEPSAGVELARRLQVPLLVAKTALQRYLRELEVVDVLVAMRQQVQAAKLVARKGGGGGGKSKGSGGKSKGGKGKKKGGGKAKKEPEPAAEIGTASFTSAAGGISSTVLNPHLLAAETKEAALGRKQRRTQALWVFQRLCGIAEVLELAATGEYDSHFAMAHLLDVGAGVRVQLRADGSLQGATCMCLCQPLVLQCCTAHRTRCTPRTVH